MVRANHSLAIRANRRCLFQSWMLITYIDIQNICNRKPVTDPRYDMRTGTLDESNALGILPSIGISAEFQQDGGKQTAGWLSFCKSITFVVKTVHW